MCAHMWKLNEFAFFFVAAAAAALLFLTNMKLFPPPPLFFSLFSDNKKAVLHSTFYTASHGFGWREREKWEEKLLVLVEARRGGEGGKLAPAVGLRAAEKWMRKRKAS